MRADFNLFARRVRIKQFFYKDQPPPATSSFKTPSGWTPPRGVSTNLESYLHGVEGDLLRWKKTKQPKSNLTLEEIAALDSLKNNHVIGIKPADKGGAVNNQRDYTKLPSDHTKKANQTIGNCLRRCKKNKLLPPKVVNHLITITPRTSIFHLLPKIHKIGVPGRPIVSAINSPTETISEYVDFFLKPLNMKLPSYVGDTKDLLMRLQTLPDLPPESIPYTVDVSSLYTSIPHSDGITACDEALETRVDKDPHTSILLKLIRFVLTNNYFEFNGEFFHQTHGTAMGTKMAPNYACIFMGKLEQELLESAQLHPLIWLRYIDDVLLIWTHVKPP